MQERRSLREIGEEAASRSGEALAARGALFLFFLHKHVGFYNPKPMPIIYICVCMYVCVYIYSTPGCSYSNVKKALCIVYIPIYQLEYVNIPKIRFIKVIIMKKFEWNSYFLEPCDVCHFLY
jgi:hypothetical protein